MAVTRSQKEKFLKDLEQMVSESRALFLTDYRGLAVKDMRGLRLRLGEMDCRYRVVKNRLLALALAGQGVELPAYLLTGPTAIGFCYGDVVGPAKALSAFAEETKVLAIKGGILERRILTSQEILSLAKLPPREELFRRLLGQIQVPLYGLGGVLQAPLRNFLGVLAARRDQLQAVQG
ncbi:MAG: 50S ribosomal protein L10 [Chloroflexi bacterium]|nr:50S ribosomal protein L10 [Chloroflexota bacterium]